MSVDVDSLHFVATLFISLSIVFLLGVNKRETPEMISR
jgi:hypothetical protein